jgi:hypothetical protein
MLLAAVYKLSGKITHFYHHFESFHSMVTCGQPPELAEALGKG